MAATEIQYLVFSERCVAKKTRAIIDGLWLPNRPLLRKVKAVGKCLVMGEEGGGETGYLCFLPFAKLHLPLLPGTAFQAMLQPE